MKQIFAPYLAKFKRVSSSIAAEETNSFHFDAVISASYSVLPQPFSCQTQLACFFTLLLHGINARAV